MLLVLSYYKIVNLIAFLLSLCNIVMAMHICLVLLVRFQKGINLYRVNWNCTGLKHMNMALLYVLPAVLLSADTRTIQKSANQPKAIDVLFKISST